MSDQKTTASVAEYMKDIHNPPGSDPFGLDGEGKRIKGFRSTGTGSNVKDRPNAHKPVEMKLTQEEQDILDGKKGPEMAKVLKTVVEHGKLFGATKLVNLGGAPHSSFFMAPAYMESMLKISQKCADAGLKSYAPYTINPRPWYLYNEEISSKEATMAIDGYKFQLWLQKLHMQLGSRDIKAWSCTSYLPEVGNHPPVGTYVAWAESSAVNFGNSVLGIRSNRNACGMELMCALIGKAPFFGLMTDEGRKAKWLIDVRTKGEPNWGVLGGAIGMKVTEDVPYIIGVDKYLGGKVDNVSDNVGISKLKMMGSATASNGAVGLYHVEGVTPEAFEQGRDLLAEGYQTYVVDDAELARVRGGYANLWEDKKGEPTRVHIGCPHCTFEELHRWGENITKALREANQQKVAIPVNLGCSKFVEEHFLDQHPILYRDMKRAGITFTNICILCFSGLAGFGKLERPVTNSNKARVYTNARLYDDGPLLKIILTGEVPS
jgi:predicted aconitase